MPGPRLDLLLMLTWLGVLAGLLGLIAPLVTP
jgi:hypothetical protein